MTLMPQRFRRIRQRRNLLPTGKRSIYSVVLLLPGFALIGQSSMAVVCAQLAGGAAAVRQTPPNKQQTQNRRLTLHGRVVDARSGEPVAKVKIIVSGSSQSTTTDDNGGFTLTDLPPGELSLYITTIGYGLVKRTLSIKETDTAEVMIALNQEAATITEHVTVTPEPYAITETNAPSGQTLNKTELQDLSKVLISDPLRAVQALPGVTANDELRSEFSVRSAEYRRVGVFLDGILLDTFVHLLGVNEPEKITFSVINSDTINAVSLLGGAFPAKYGDSTAGVVNLETRDGNRLKPAFRFSTGLQFGTSGVVDGPLANKRGSWLIAARSSLLDYVSRAVDKVASDNNNQDSGSGNFSDIAGKFVFDLSPRNRVGFSGVYSGITGSDPRDPLANPNTVQATRSRNLLLSGFWNYAPNPQLVSQTRVFGTRFPFKYSNHNGIPNVEGELNQVGIRNDINFLTHSTHRVEGGVYLRSMSERLLTTFFPFSPPGAPINFDNYDRSSFEQGYYLQDTYTNEGLGLSLTGGVRIDHSGLTGETLVSPRTAMALRLKSNWTIRAGFGSYHQFPVFGHLFGQLGNPNLHAERATHYNASVERTFGDRYRVLAEVYDREDRDLTFALAEPRLEGNQVTFARLPFRNSVRGHARGLELTFQRRSANRLSGWVSYSYAQTQNRESQTGLSFVSDFDQRHTVNTYGSYRFTETFNLSGQWRYGSGLPMAGFFRTQGTDLFLSSQRNTTRLPAYSRVDLRANKAFLFEKWKLTLSAEVWNVLKHENLRYPVIERFDTTTGRVFRHFGGTFPVVPALGVAIEF